MGKRELALIGVFVVLGIVVYQFTAPPPPPGSESISFGSIVRNLRRNIKGAREVATTESRQTVAVDPAVKAIRINIPRPSDITLIGEDRAEVVAEMRATGRGYDPAEAKANADAAKLKIERIGDAIVASIDTSAARALPRNPSIGTLTITLTVPRRLSLRMEPHVGRFTAKALASAEILGSRGETRVSNVAGPLQLAHTGGALEIDGVASLKLNARNSRGFVRQVAGAAVLDAVGGELEIAGIGGPLEIEARNADLRIDAAKTLKPALRINATGGRLRVDGLRAEARVDGRNTEIDVTMAAAAAVTIYSTNGDVDLTPPPDGYTLDAVATEGRLTLEDGTLKPSTEPDRPGDNDQRAAGPVHGGGPPLTVHVTRGSLHVRARSAGK